MTTATAQTSPSRRSSSPAARWKPAKTRPPRASVARPAPPPCPVAELASEAAAAHRLTRTLHENQPGCDTELMDALDNTSEGVSSIMLREELWDRIKAIEDAATHRQATSLKGALFQLYLGAYHAFDPRGVIATQLTQGEVRKLDENDRRVGRLHHAALSFLETLVTDEDLTELRAWYCSPLYDGRAVCERVMRDRAGLIAEARARVDREFGRR